MGKVYIIGMGPGSFELVTPLAEMSIRDSDVLIGAARMLNHFNDNSKRKIYLTGNFSDVLAYIRDNVDRENIALLVSGDPGIFSFSSRVTSVLTNKEYEVIPGISSLQLAFARIGESWHDTFLLSLHGRTRRGLTDAVLMNKKVFIFTDKKNNPVSIAAYLFQRGIKRRKVFLFENLSLPDERIVCTDINKLRECKNEMADLCVMLIKKQ